MDIKEEGVLGNDLGQHWYYRAKSRAMLRYVEAKVAIAPDVPEDRWMRALLRYQTGQRQGAIEDADWLLEHHPKGIDLDRVIEFRQMLNRPER